jgi:aspartate/methionine/tyrosine aminotransferase
VGVAAIPVSAFVVDGHLRHLVRFAFCKDDATLDEALRRLRQLEGRARGG